MTDVELSMRLRANLLDFKALQARSGPLRMWERPGVRAFALTEDRDNVFPQQVHYSAPDALAEVLAPLEAWYRELGVSAWRVLALPGDTALEAVLHRAGLRPEGAVPAMSFSLAHARPPLLPPGITLERPDDLHTVLALNGVTYGEEHIRYYTAWRTGPMPSPEAYAVVVREAGRALACGMSFEQGDTAGLYLVASHPGARQRGLATLVMHALHSDARARGRAIAVLQATPMGHGFYQRFGYRDLGGWTNWVRRAG
jgi:GNAT superfamily N-acetyltransferase